MRFLPSDGKPSEVLNGSSASASSCSRSLLTPCRESPSAFGGASDRRPELAGQNYRIDDELVHASQPGGPRVIVTLRAGRELPPSSRNAPRGAAASSTSSAAGVMDLPSSVLRKLAGAPGHLPACTTTARFKTHNYRTSVTVGARTVQDMLGLTGAGVGIAVIDSGITTWHDDLIELRAAKLLSVRQPARRQVRRTSSTAASQPY